jgi:hypothetical protein
MATVTSWLSRVENKCRPVFAWGLAVGMVVTLLPAALLCRSLADK